MVFVNKFETRINRFRLAIVLPEVEAHKSVQKKPFYYLYDTIIQRQLAANLTAQQ